MNTWHYFYHGLTVHSDIELPDWGLFTSSPPDPEETNGETVFIRLNQAAVPEPDAPNRTDEYRFHVQNVGWFEVFQGREIRVSPETQPFDKRLRLFLTGSAWGVLMYQRGALLIHASAVMFEGGAVAFCGRRGAGKSTLAAYLSTLGHPAVSDDLCCVRMVSGEQPCVLPSVPRFKLWEDAMNKLGWQETSREPDHFRAGKYHLPFAESPPLRARIPLRRIYMLGWGHEAIQRLRGFNAVSRLTAAGTWRGDLLVAAGDAPLQFQKYIALLQAVDCWEFRRPRDLTGLTRNLDHLVGHITEVLPESPTP